MTWSIKKLGICVLVIISGGIVVAGFALPQYSTQLNLLALVATLVVLVLYAYDTHRIGNEAVHQSEIQTMPIMTLYIRYVDGSGDDQTMHRLRQYAVTHLEDNAIKPSSFYGALRSVGNGPAFNVTMESNNFKVEKYQTQFFAPKKDEHAIKIIKKPNDKIRDLTELNGEIFIIKCESVFGRRYEYKYKIVDINERTVEFLK